MTFQPETKNTGSSRVFERKVVDVHQVFSEAMACHLEDGRIVNKEKLEQSKLKISARLVNLVVSGGVLLFATDGKGIAPSHEELNDGSALTEEDLFHLLRETIYLMLNELNKPDVNLLRVSLAKSFRDCLQRIFSDQARSDPAKFPVKIFQDFHAGRGYFIGINMRNTRSVGDDIDRIEADADLKLEIIEGRSCRHSDGNLMKLFSQDTTRPGTAAG
ncbi:MAG: hypothetical protein FVQ81_12915 [Candidatus Glassbacteria bacterium]|nr:hypothetical protein [Candidatus Glassbacteria bacterium]